MTDTPTRKKNAEKTRLEALGIEILSQRIVSGCVINTVSPETMLKIVRRWCRWKTCTPGLFMSPETKDGVTRWTVCDGGTECFCEDFFCESIAIRWLLERYQDVEDLYDADRRNGRDEKERIFLQAVKREMTGSGLHE